MRFLIIGIVCILIGWRARVNPESIRKLLNNRKTQIPQSEIERTTLGGKILLICGILLVILGIISIIVMLFS